MPSLKRIAVAAAAAAAVLAASCGPSGSGRGNPPRAEGSDPPPAATPSPPPAATPSPPSVAWPPIPGTTWQIQFTGKRDYSAVAQVFDIDAFETKASEVGALHDAGRRAICYVNAGGWEDWRPDRGRFPTSILGKPLDGWEGERWLDIRRAALRPILQARMDLCKQKGFDGIELDNVDGYANETGFPLAAKDQLAFNRWLAGEAHARGLAAGLKNDLEQIDSLEPAFDFAINEECVEFDECELLMPFVRANKAVFHIEYSVRLARACPQTLPRRFSTIRKRLALDAWRQTCAEAGRDEAPGGQATPIH